ncbi:hypothetical protein LCGC14_0204410 [marine sediment metagenome]|uniref:Uncharacterized protein n=1 Tax=marine sediment metagenome TaxID=412755 RepID=A0A0F9UZJ7_9ZZZZ|nr:hypothetical protein [Phycisphaerae bacterium]HDZ44615.1 hypothetical protein [Phycisphaerae bacterium]
MNNTRRMLAAVCILAASFAGGGLSHWLLSAGEARAQEAGHPKYVRATDLYIVDKNTETVRSVINVSDDGTMSFTVRDKNGRSRFTLESNRASGHPELKLLDANGRTRAKLVTLSDGRPVMHLLGESGRSAVQLSVEGAPRIALTDKSGAVRADLSLDAGGSASLTIYDAGGKELWKAPPPPEAIAAADSAEDY